ncbi:MAG TPA: hypothetical protein VHP83_16085 [Aggregatilineaceae bacterium]|nr:hypothetical protein [Aggregatilineaceae bacterium]
MLKRRWILLAILLFFCLSNRDSMAQTDDGYLTIPMDREVEGMQWSLDGKLLAVSVYDPQTYDQNLRIIEADSGATLADFDYPADEIAWSPDGTKIAVDAVEQNGDETGSGNQIHYKVSILDVRTGQKICENGIEMGHFGDITSLAWSPDGAQLVVSTSEYVTSEAYSSYVELWDAADCATLERLVDDQGTLNAYFDGFAWSPDGSRLAMNNVHGYFAMWDMEKREALYEAAGFDFERPGWYMAWSPSGKTIAVSNNTTIRLWDAQSGDALLTLPGFWIGGLRWMGDDDHLAVVECGQITILDPWSGRRLSEFKVDQPVALRWSPDGGRVAYLQDQQLEIRPVAFAAVPESPTVTAQLVEPPAPDLPKLDQLETPISAENAGQLALVGQAGRDNISSALWSPDGTIALLGTKGVWLYDDLSAPPKLLHIDNGTMTRMAFGSENLLYLAVENEEAHDFGIRVVNVHTGEIVRVFEGHTGPITDWDFSDDGTRLVTGSDDQTVRIWDTATGETLHVLWGHTTPVMSVDFNTGGDWVVSAAFRDMRLWDVQTGMLKNVVYSSRWTVGDQLGVINNAMFSPDDASILYVELDDGNRWVTLRQWKFTGGSEGYRIPAYGTGYAGSSREYELAFNGKTMIPYISYGSWLDVLDVDTGEEVPGQWLVSCIMGTGAVRFSPDGSTLAVGVAANMICDPHPYEEPKTIWLFDTATGELQVVLRGLKTPVKQLEFSSDGKKLLGVGTDDSLMIWDVATGERLVTNEEYSNSPEYLLFGAHNELVSIERGGSAVRERYWRDDRVRSVAVVEPPSNFDGISHPLSYAYPGVNPNHTSTRRYSLWLSAQQTLQVQLTLHKGQPIHFSTEYDSDFNTMISPSGDWLASSIEGNVMLWNLNTGTIERMLLRARSAPHILQFSPDGRLLAAALHNQVRIWGIPAGRKDALWIPDRKFRISQMVISRDNQWVAASDGTGVIWMVALDGETAPFRIDTGLAAIQHLALSTDGGLLAVSTGDEIQLWDAAAQQMLAVIAAQQGGVTSLVFNAETTVLVSGGTDGTIRVWGIGSAE